MELGFFSVTATVLFESDKLVHGYITQIFFLDHSVVGIFPGFTLLGVQIIKLECNL